MQGRCEMHRHLLHQDEQHHFLLGASNLAHCSIYILVIIWLRGISTDQGAPEHKKRGGWLAYYFEKKFHVLSFHTEIFVNILSLELETSGAEMEPSSKMVKGQVGRRKRTSQNRQSGEESESRKPAFCHTHTFNKGILPIQSGSGKAKVSLTKNCTPWTALA